MSKSTFQWGPMASRKYDILTWDSELGKFTEQAGMTNPTVNIEHHQIRPALRELQTLGYRCNRNYCDSDASVLVERRESEADE